MTNLQCLALSLFLLLLKITKPRLKSFRNDFDHESEEEVYVFYIHHHKCIIYYLLLLFEKNRK